VVYVIAGPPRCGKSVLARRLTTAHGIPFISTDLIWALVAVNQPEWRTAMQKGPDRIPTAAKMFEPYLERAITFLQPIRQPCGIEGEVITPGTTARLAAECDLRAVFLVRSSATAVEIADRRGPNPWLATSPPEVVATVTAEVLSWSMHVRTACRRLDIPCFDVSRDFERAMAAASSALMADARTA
jgi:hypothetical protein